MPRLKTAIFALLVGAHAAAPAFALEAEVKQLSSGPVLHINGQANAQVSVFVNFDTGPQLKQIDFAGKQGVNIVSLPIAVSWPQPGEEPDFSQMDERMVH
jgi:hypothetical protein